jgi:hypothetical protein
MHTCDNCGDETWEEKSGYDPETGYVIHVCPGCYGDEVTPWSKRPPRGGA